MKGDIMKEQNAERREGIFAVTVTSVFGLGLLTLVAYVSFFRHIAGLGYVFVGLTALLGVVMLSLSWLYWRAEVRQKPEK